MRHEARERLEIELLLEAIQRRYGYDFRGYALASLRRRLWHRVYGEGLADDLRAAGAHPARPGLHGPPAARPLDQRHRDVPRPELSPRAARARLPAAAHLSVHPRLERGLLDRRGDLLAWRSRCTRRACSSARGSTRPTSTRPRWSARASGAFALERMQLLHRELPARRRHASRSRRTTAPRATSRASIPALAAGTVFAQHNLVTDGSFNEFQLIVCRNVLIYFGAELQEKVLGLFGASLTRLRDPRAGPQGVAAPLAPRRRVRAARRGREDLPAAAHDPPWSSSRSARRGAACTRSRPCWAACRRTSAPRSSSPSTARTTAATACSSTCSTRAAR